MRRVVVYGLISFLLFLTHSGSAQTISQGDIDLLVERIEDLFEEKDNAQIDLTEMVDAIEELRQHPVLLNSASPDELSRLFFLDEVKVHRIIAYIHTYGKILSANELYAIEGITRKEADLLATFSSLEQPPTVRKTTVKDAFRYGKHQIIGRYQRVLQEQRGYMHDSVALAMKYAGNPDKYYLRYRFKYRDRVSFGVTAEKDAGEPFFSGINKYGFDFYSLHFYLHNKDRILHKLVVGDYHLTFGQGLTMWSGYSFGKAADGVSIKKNGKGITPNTSANETEFLRGIAATIKLKRHYITGFASHLRRDGTPSFNEDKEVEYVSSLTTDGLHRTKNEISKKGVLPATTAGLRYEWNGRKLRIGATGHGTWLKIPIIREDIPYNFYLFSGNSLINAGVDVACILGNHELFGEASYSSNGGFAVIGGLRSRFASRFETTISIRHYEKDYANFFSNAFGINSNNSNETGVYAGATILLNRLFTLSAYADVYRFPYLKYQIWASTRGNDYSVQLNMTPGRYVFMYLRYRNSLRELGVVENLIRRTAALTKHSIRWHGDFSITGNLTLKTRLEYIVTLSKERRNGFLMYQDITYRTKDTRFSSSLRYAWFNTDSYDERIYAYENDLLYVFSVPAYYYKGNRIYLLCSYKITKNITAWLRISNTFYSDRDSIGGGGEEIYGSNRTDVKVQIVMKI